MVMKKRLSRIQLLAVNASRELGRFFSVEVNGRALRFKVDSGADVSVVPITFQGCPSSLDPPGGEQLLGPGRNRLDLIGPLVRVPPASVRHGCENRHGPCTCGGHRTPSKKSRHSRRHRHHRRRKRTSRDAAASGDNALQVTTSPPAALGTAATPEAAAQCKLKRGHTSKVPFEGPRPGRARVAGNRAAPCQSTLFN
ncbi:hypothetical protein HPB50_013810 [Hyalomma asiaticum]|uniref:Uncharacterized protein n=1 Tax=Hyalomma asiaticum TaxID=266040 RepID=A0ACB7SHI0_HYAAI|nr:hypothetical protein HPB50_013810 [Hyalomma asiaticum]